MSDTNNSGPAFPQHPIVVNGYSYSNEHQGMTLRDYFAAKAMQAYIGSFPGSTADWRDADQWVPSKAYEMADAMLEARK